MSTYVLLAMFMVSGESYVEARDLSLQGCAGRAAIERARYLADGLDKLVGEVRWYCAPSVAVPTK